MNNRVERDLRTDPVASAADAPAVDSGVINADGGAIAGLHDAFNSELAGEKLVEVTQPAPEPN